MTHQIDLSQALAEFSAAVALQQGARFRGTILFGSHARHSAHEQSDVDVAFDMLLNRGIDIQPIPLSEDHWDHPERHSNPWLIQAIRREGIGLFASDNH